ncbi:hypothetical protein F3Y22_tig00111810pilonHSYRG00107 [Hibiscus syriacus]|uniref:Uncharacterized protein n=1 Tax=Hibiscus syriacus TaxID=106335 RepID=A0A6A2XBW9_HIBSY|nr:hypothetical protein F3Y22_tig00111810pilonHSYRG00107 [Hibiscus syriacus]
MQGQRQREAALVVVALVEKLALLEKVALITPPIVLDRPGSPVEFETQPSLQKEGDPSYADTAIKTSTLRIKSYVATLATGVNNLHGTSIGFLDEEIIIQDGDVFVDRKGPYLVITFSDRVHEAINQNMKKTVIPFYATCPESGWRISAAAEHMAPLSAMDKHEDLFGPWMIALNRRRMKKENFNPLVAGGGQSFAEKELGRSNEKGKQLASGEKNHVESTLKADQTGRVSRPLGVRIAMNENVIRTGIDNNSINGSPDEIPVSYVNQLVKNVAPYQAVQIVEDQPPHGSSCPLLADWVQSATQKLDKLGSSSAMDTKCQPFVPLDETSGEIRVGLGAASPSYRRYFRRFMTLHHPSVVFLFETKLAANVQMRLFANWVFLILLELNLLVSVGVSG